MKDIPHIIDYQYFYDKFDPARAMFVAHYTCGLTHDAVVVVLHANNVDISQEILTIIA